MAGRTVVVVGAGGLGSVIAENLLHQGCQRLALIDPDHVELSNLNRIVGARYSDALRGRSKVAVLRRHLLQINPSATVEIYRGRIEDPRARALAAKADWIVLATDNHSSRAEAQRLSLDLFTPLVSAGVNITVNSGAIEDMSGEVIICRVGSGFCLNCIGRINHIKVAAETNPDPSVREGLVERGYVRGTSVIEPAVKTLNSIVGSLAVDVLVNEYTNRQQLHPILVYENNKGPTIYEDHRTFELFRTGCFSCDLSESWS